MNCLSRIEMQEYVDNEVAPAAGVEIHEHLGKCNKCTDLYNLILNDKNQINRLLAEAEEEVTEGVIPQFNPPEGRRIKKIYLRVTEILVAASIIGLMIIIRPSGTPAFTTIPEAEMMVYEFYDGKDLNQMWHDKSQIIFLQDEKGNVIQSIITN
jgi:predicted anti-sigma-YlaC factor YlaD